MMNVHGGKYSCSSLNDVKGSIHNLKESKVRGKYPLDFMNEALSRIPMSLKVSIINEIMLRN